MLINDVCTYTGKELMFPKQLLTEKDKQLQQQQQLLLSWNSSGMEAIRGKLMETYM